MATSLISANPKDGYKVGLAGSPIPTTAEATSILFTRDILVLRDLGVERGVTQIRRKGNEDADGGDPVSSSTLSCFLTL